MAETLEKRVTEASKKRGDDRKARAKPNLRLVQKAQTRARILEAALHLFTEVGFYGTTVDQIASAIGASRATFYLHFPDKEAVLNALLEDYLARAVTQMSRLPGPVPSRRQIDDWMTELLGFYKREDASISMISEISSLSPSNDKVQNRALEALTEALGQNVRAFAKQPDCKDEIERQVTADALIVQITWAARTSAARRGSAYAKAALDIAARLLHEFVQDPRFSRNPS